jgi:hypothetical protein
MANWEEENWVEEEMAEEDSCDYGVSEICCDPHTKSMGLCTTECASYMKSVEEDEKETT